MSRRRLLGGPAALAAAPAPVLALAALSPNAEVFRLAQGVIEAETACLAAYSIPSLTVEEEQAIVVKDYVDWLAYAALEDLVRVLEKQA